MGKFARDLTQSWPAIRPAHRKVNMYSQAPQDQNKNMQTLGSIQGAASVGMNVPKSEYQRASHEVDCGLARLAELVNVLERRLHPLITPGSNSEDKTGGCVPCPILSPFGQQLRNYSAEINIFNDRLQAILSQLALD